MAGNHTRDSTVLPRVPTPRTAADDPLPEAPREQHRSRPPTEYWDVETAGWHSRGPLPVSRRDE
jgi:hypothetical protein